MFLKSIDKNWLNGTYSLKKKFWETFKHTNDVYEYEAIGFPFLEMNKKVIVRGSVDDRISIFNRWTLELEHVY